MKRLFALILATLMIVSCFTVLPLTATAEAWDGTTATAPKGSGTKDDPYLIENGANLYWVSQKASASSGTDYIVRDVFNGVYFKQTADIDLGGKLLPSIGAYTGSSYGASGASHKYTVFGGIYDGQGYSISNVLIANASKLTTKDDGNANWPMGLFGIIRGATIKNVNLVNASLASTTMKNYGVGLLVGYALAESDMKWNTVSGTNNSEPYQTLVPATTYSDDFNKILNCSVSGTLTVAGPSGNYAGGIAAVAYSTTIENCTSNVTINANKAVNRVGGIVAYAGYGCKIDNCINNGSITYTDVAGGETHIGGIVGSVSENVPGKTFGAGISITNCINNGDITVSQAQTAALCVGGIVGAGSYMSLDAHTISNCFNLGDFSIAATNNMYRAGAIMGCSFITAGSDSSSWDMNNCYTLDTTTGTGAGETAAYQCNEGVAPALSIALHTQRRATNGADGVRKTKAGLSAIITTNCGVKTETEMKAMESYKAITGYSAAKAAANRDWAIARITTRIAPAGSGTAEDPYLIACAENLVWMGETIWSLNNEKNVVTNPFEDTYFLQVCDIDLGGKAIRSIGYYFSDAFETAYSVFGGNYNGQGFAIKNGFVIEPNASHGVNAYWAGGLFGIIYGATIENVNLESMVTISKNIGGVLVGRAAREKGAEANESFNVIRNCSTDADCYVRLTTNNTTSNYNPDTLYRAGGIIGYAECVTVENCTNAATVYVTGGNSPAGGIAGSVGFGTLIDNCVNYGTIILDTNVYKNMSETGMGGIAGAILPVDAKLVDNKAGDVTIQNCANYGHLEWRGAQISHSTYWGGILGGVSNPNYQGTYLIKNCFNNQTPNLITSTEHIKAEGGNNYRYGSILGVAYQNNASAGFTTIQDCYGVAIDPVDTTYYDFGIAIVNNNTAGKNPQEGRPVTFKIGANTYAATSANAATVKAATILSSADIAAKITAANITGATGAFVDPNGAIVGDLAVQEHNSDATVRFVALIDKNVTAAMFDIIASYKIGNEIINSKLNHFDLDYVYDQINAAGALVEAPEGKYFALVTINNIPTDRGDVTFYVTPSVVKDSATVKGATLVYTYDKTDLEDLSALTVNGAAPVVGYNPNAVGAVNVAEMLQKKLTALGANATLAENGNIVFNVVPTLEAGTWSIDVSESGIYVVSDTAHGLIAAYEYMLPKLGLANDLADSIKSANGTYAVDTTKDGELRVMYHNILTYSLQLGYTVLDRADLLLLTYQTLNPDVIGLQEAGTTGANFIGSDDFADLHAWLNANYDLYRDANNAGNPIYVKKNTFTVEDHGYGKNIGGYGTQYVVLTKGDKTFAVANLHFEANSIFDGIAVVGDQARYDNGQLLIETVKSIQTTYSCPVVVGGDFNANLYSSPVGLELTMGSAAVGSAYKALVKYDTLDEAQKAEYTKDAYGYAYKLDAEENRVYLRATEGATADKAGNFEAVRHIALDYVDSNTTHGIKAPEAGDTRYETVTSINKDSKNAIDHVLYKGCGENTITFNQYKVVDDCFALTSSDHAPHYVDIVLN